MTPRAGFILPLVLGVLAVVGVLAAGGLIAARADFRVARAMADAIRVEGDAERLAVQASRAWPDSVLRALPVSDSIRIRVGSSVMQVTRKASRFFLFEGIASSATGGVVRRIGLLAAPEPAGFGVFRAVSSNGAVRADSSVVIKESPAGRAPRCDRSDSLQTGWVRASSATPAAGSLAPWMGIADFTIPDGAVVAPGPGTSRVGCRYADAGNWGDPGGTGPCREWRPVVHALGDLTVSGGVGQGVLLVQGDLEIRGGFRYDGFIVVGGSLRLTGRGTRVLGAISILDRNGTGSDLTGSAAISYSACILEAAGRWLGPIRPLASGAWFGEY